MSSKTFQGWVKISCQDNPSKRTDGVLNGSSIDCYFFQCQNATKGHQTLNQSINIPFPLDSRTGSFGFEGGAIRIVVHQQQKWYHMLNQSINIRLPASVAAVGMIVERISYWPSTLWELEKLVNQRTWSGGWVLDIKSSFPTWRYSNCDTSATEGISHVQSINIPGKFGIASGGSSGFVELFATIQIVVYQQQKGYHTLNQSINIHVPPSLRGAAMIVERISYRLSTLWELEKLVKQHT